MDEQNALAAAVRLLMGADPALGQIVGLSLRVSLTAVCFAALLGLPLGAVLALACFPGRGAVVVAIDAMMGLPPVVAGLAVYLLLSRSGPLGTFGLLFTPAAIIAALTRQTVEDLLRDYRELFLLDGVGAAHGAAILLWAGRFSLLTALLAGLGRALAEVGAILVVGGNIAGSTRTMTTAIALETSKGDLPLALGLGIVLLTLTLAINAGVRLAGRA
jgi:tungstate transport system permease protein